MFSSFLFPPKCKAGKKLHWHWLSMKEKKHSHRLLFSRVSLSYFLALERERKRNQHNRRLNFSSTHTTVTHTNSDFQGQRPPQHETHKIESTTVIKALPPNHSLSLSHLINPILEKSLLGSEWVRVKLIKSQMKLIILYLSLGLPRFSGPLFVSDGTPAEEELL